MILRIGLLGPLSVLVDDRERAIPTGNQRTVLAALTLAGNRAVSLDDLAGFVWDARPPVAAVATVRNYVKRLRQALGPGGADRLRTRAGGYLLELGEDEADVTVFERCCRRALTEAGDEVARAALADALDLWRGPPLADVESASLREKYGPALERLRVQTLEHVNEADLRAGRYEHLIPLVRDLLVEYPLSERFHAQLMLALYHSGRRAQALAAYQDARRVLVDELGIEPGAPLRDLHERILAGSDEPVTPPSLGPVAARSRSNTAPPRQLPAAPAYFTGRDAELDQLTALARGTRPNAAGTVVICAIDGMAGIGKTALAVHAAHRLAEQFPDGQLFLDLHGYTQGHPPRTAGEALTWLLQALGVPTQRIPADEEQAAALYRQHLAGTRTLIVLDNAAAEAQIRPLLPGADACLVLVTSRRRLKGLDDAHTLPLDVLPEAQAITLLRAVAGRGQIAAGDPLLGEVAGSCGYLPLALRIAAALLRHRPAWSLQQLAGQLRDQRLRVAALRDGERELAHVFELSYMSLDTRHRALFRRLGLIPGPNLDVYAASALVEVDLATATGLLEDLVDHNLVTAYAPGRYRLHDLLRAYARELAVAGCSAQEQRAALDALYDHYLYTAAGAMNTLYPAEPSRRPKVQPPATATPDTTNAATARAWLDAELANLTAAAAHMAEAGWPSHAISLSTILYWLTLAHPTEAGAVHRAALQAAVSTGDKLAQANAMRGLGMVAYVQARFPDAAEHLQQALAIARDAADQRVQLSALINLGTVRRYQGRLDQAAEHFRAALTICRPTEDRLSQTRALYGLGVVYTHLGRYTQAAECLQEELTLFRAVRRQQVEPDPSIIDSEAGALDRLGVVAMRQGRYERAAECHRQAIAMHRQTGDARDEAEALVNLGNVEQRRRHYAEAAEHLHSALAFCRMEDIPHCEADALNILGLIELDHARFPDATRLFDRALALCRTTGHPIGEAEARLGLAQALHATGKPDQAREHRAAALELARLTGDLDLRTRARAALEDRDTTPPAPGATDN